MLKKIKIAIYSTFHFIVMILGGTIRLSSIDRPITLMLLNRIILIMYITWRVSKWLEI